jgi:hypothetical protein
MIAEAPLQTNAADPEQIEEAARAERLNERQESVDARAELGNLNHRRVFVWPTIKAVLNEVVSERASDAACREYAVEQRIYKQRMVEWMKHPEMFIHAIQEGLRRDADEATNRHGRRAK